MLARNRPDVTPSDSDRRESDVPNKLEAAFDRDGPGWGCRHRYVRGRCRLLVGMLPPGVLGLVAVLLYPLLLALLREPL